VVAILLDIRGFSNFAERGGSFDTAYYLRSIYTTILRGRFPDRDFFKPTGDGMMLIHHLPRTRLNGQRLSKGSWSGLKLLSTTSRP
jgi:hypothetical protein